MTRVLIGGIGNILLGDDGVGPYTAHLLEARYQFGEGVEVVDFGTPGLDFVSHLTGISHLILIDSVDNGCDPGTVTLYRKRDILKHGPRVRMDPHSPALAESLLVADLTGEGPGEVLLVGVTGTAFEGTVLSPPVKAAVDSAIAEVLIEVGRLGLTFVSRPAPGRGAWWDSALDAPASGESHIEV